MIKQKLISFKISFKNLKDLDEFVRNTSRLTTRNAELNAAVALYLRIVKAREAYNYEGNIEPCRILINELFGRKPAELWH